MMISKLKGDKKMNTDKIYAEQIANEYAPFEAFEFISFVTPITLSKKVS